MSSDIAGLGRDEAGAGAPLDDSDEGLVVCSVTDLPPGKALIVGPE